MKRLTLAVFFSLGMIVFASCVMATDEEQDRHNDRLLAGIAPSGADFSEIQSINGIPVWIARRVTFKRDQGDNWQSPCATLALGTGDCEDFAILYLDILFARFGEKGDLVMVDAESRRIEGGGEYNHAAIRRADGRVIEARSGQTHDWPVKYSYSWDDVFNGRAK